ncbi:hypothetical protein [Kribbella flavida]|uniref:hypothetical protein n=1 Tax=Kribbella flavida TaxID=182640 RepID=UPI00019BDDD6|nr:hypothetical protein [Kribbella flavida]
MAHELPDTDWVSFEAAAAERYERAGLAWPGVVVRVRSPMAGALAAPIAAEVLAGRRSGESLAQLRDRMDECLSVNLRLSVDGPADEAITIAVRQAVGLDRTPAEPSPRPLTKLLVRSRTTWGDDDPMAYLLIGSTAAGVSLVGGLLGWFPVGRGTARWAMVFAVAGIVLATVVGFVVRQCALAVRRRLCRRPRFLAQQLGGAGELSHARTRRNAARAAPRVGVPPSADGASGQFL